jgi:EF hand
MSFCWPRDKDFPMIKLALPAAALAAALFTAGLAHAQMPPAAELLKAWDTNADGAVDRAEWTAAGRPAERFDMVDADKDGKISAAELEAAMAAMRARGG